MRHEPEHFLFSKPHPMPLSTRIGRSTENLMHPCYAFSIFQKHPPAFTLLSWHQHFCLLLSTVFSVQCCWECMWVYKCHAHHDGRCNCIRVHLVKVLSPSSPKCVRHALSRNEQFWPPLFSCSSSTNRAHSLLSSREVHSCNKICATLSQHWRLMRHSVYIRLVWNKLIF